MPDRLPVDSFSSFSAVTQRERRNTCDLPVAPEEGFLFLRVKILWAVSDSAYFPVKKWEISLRQRGDL